MGEEEMQQTKHVVVFSTLEQGHLIPSFQFSLQLANGGLAVTFVTTPQNARSIDEKLVRARSLSPRPLRLRIHHLSLPLPPGHEESCHLLHPSRHVDLYLATEQLQTPFQCLVRTFFHTATSDWPPPACLVGDMFTGWVQDVAREVGIPGFTFFTSPVYGTLVYYSLWLHLPREDEIRLPDVPEWLPLSRSDLSPVLLRATPSDPWRLFVCRQLEKNAQTRGHVVNSFAELEPQVIEFMKRSTGRPVWTVGPLLPSASPERMSFARGEDGRSCVDFLNGQAPASVVYVSFGSRNFLSQAQVTELALGLRASGKPFVWALRSPPGEEAHLPEDFEEATPGLVIRGWAPQLLVLSHPSTGAFVSHCGWNSMMERVSTDVPLVCWPMAGEQFLNCKWFAQELGVAVQARRDNNGMVSRDEVRRVVGLVLGEEGRELRRRASELAQIARAAVAEGGSSNRNWDSMIKHISSLSPPSIS